MKQDDLEDLFKKSFKDYEAEVNPSVWKNIRVWLKWGGLAFLFNAILNKIGLNTVIAVLSSVAAVIGTVGIMTWTNKTSETTQPGAEKNTSAPKTNVVCPPVPVDSANKAKTYPLLNEHPKDNSKTDLNDKGQKTNDEQKKELKPANTGVEPNKKDKKKIESVIAKFSEEPIASISASPVGGTVPLIVNLTNTGTGKTNKWTFSDGKKANDASNPVHVFETPGIYSVILSSVNADGKTATDSIKVEVTGNSSITSVPKEFSPNGDGKLDVFVLQSKNIAHMDAKIFDKKGTVVYKSEGIDAKWDGNDLQGNKAKEGIYFYLINAEGLDGKKYEQKGSVNLTR